MKIINVNSADIVTSAKMVLSHYNVEAEDIVMSGEIDIFSTIGKAYNRDNGEFTEIEGE